VRSRPKVKLLLSPSFVTPGTQLLAETVLQARSETPIAFVSMSLCCKVFSAAGAGKSRAEQTTTLYLREWRSPAGTLTVGEHRHRVAFDLPDTLPPTYAGADANIDYVIRVHVSIPWWPDRVETFTVPVASADAPSPPPPRPQSFATSPEGPRGKDSFMEVALESTQLAAGEVLSGSVSVQNLRGKRIRGIEVAVVEVESVSLPTFGVREARRYAIRVRDGAPREGEAIPFGIRLPESATPTFRAGAIQVTSHLEVRAIVAWGEDIVVRPPLLVTPRASAPRSRRGWIAPVGRERRAIVWQRASQRASLVSDPDAERMYGTRGVIAIEIRTEQRDADFWLVAKLSWPSLGLDLDIGERKWSDVLSLDVVKSGDAQADGRFAAHAREHAQAREVVTPELMIALLRFEDVKLDDATATLATRGTAHATEPVEAFVVAVLHAADAIAAAADRVPPPVMLAPHVLAWRAFAERLRGRLELGRMHVHDGAVGRDRVTVGTEWTRSGMLVGTRVRVVVDPPLDAAPTSPEDVVLSRVARDAWRDLAARAHAVRVERDAVLVELEGKLADPNEAMPILELAVSLRRALAGLGGAGPFR
jgi:hypothetical protein